MKNGLASALFPDGVRGLALARHLLWDCPKFLLGTLAAIRRDDGWCAMGRAMWDLVEPAVEKVRRWARIPALEWGEA